MARNLKRAVKKSIERKSLVLEEHFKAFQNTLTGEVEEHIIAPLLNLILAYKAGDGPVVKAQIEAFEKFFENRLTEKTDVGSVVP